MELGVEKSVDVGADTTIHEHANPHDDAGESEIP